jgi:hypothetical protein
MTVISDLKVVSTWLGWSATPYPDAPDRDGDSSSHSAEHRRRCEHAQDGDSERWQNGRS